MLAVALVAMALVTPVLPPARTDALPASFYADATVRSHGGIALVGDSLTFAAWSDLPQRFEEQQWGPFQFEVRSARFTVTTTESATSGLDAVRRLKQGGFDPPIWIVALGTNDAGPTYGVDGAAAALIDAMMAVIGAGHRVVWVNVYKRGSPSSTAAFNAALEAATARHPGLAIADWHSVVAANTDWLTDDGVHLNLAGSIERNRFLAQAALAFASLVCDPAPTTTTTPTPTATATATARATSVGNAAAATLPAVRLCHR